MMQTNKRADVCEHNIQQLSDEKTSKLKQEKKQRYEYGNVLWRKSNSALMKVDNTQN